MARDDFPRSITETLAKRAAFICSNPDCRASTIGPGSGDALVTYIGIIAHICAASPGGPRYDNQMKTDERKGIGNGILLCASCALMIDKNAGVNYSSKLLRNWKEQHEAWVSSNLNKRPLHGHGGEGGSGTIFGDSGTIIGGRGGEGGVGGNGGKGGSGIIYGNNGTIVGGDGGSAGTADGRGGRGARGPLELQGWPSSFWGFGKGGDGGNLPEYNQRISLLKTLREEYLIKFPDEAQYINSGIEQVPVNWINQRLLESDQTWQVEMGPNGYILPPLKSA